MASSWFEPALPPVDTQSVEELLERHAKYRNGMEAVMAAEEIIYRIRTGRLQLIENVTLEESES